MFTLPRTTKIGLWSDCSHCQQRSAHMFCNLDEAAFLQFDTIGARSDFETGTKIFEEETPMRGVFILCRGRVKLSCTSKQGKTLILRIAGPGDVLGLGAVLSNANYEVTAEAIEPVELKSIRREDFLQFVQNFGDASLNAAEMLSKEYRLAFFDVRRLALSASAAARLASVLLDWARASSKPSELRFNMALTHEELASLIGSSRETVTRLLGRFKREKLIQMHGASIRILEPEKLEAFVA